MAEAPHSLIPRGDSELGSQQRYRSLAWGALERGWGGASLPGGRSTTWSTSPGRSISSDSEARPERERDDGRFRPVSRV